MNGVTETLTAEILRATLRSRLASQHYKETDTVFIDELGVCQGSAKIDIAVVNGQLHGYEIKSDRDSLRRLSSQAVLYSKVFDRVTLVCGERHVSHALDSIPAWWGVLRLAVTTKGPLFKFVRRGRKNPNREIRALTEFLWREEALALLEQRQPLHGLRSKRRADLWGRICELFTLEEVASAVRAHLKATAESRGRPARLS